MFLEGKMTLLYVFGLTGLESGCKHRWSLLMFKVTCGGEKRLDY